MAVLLDFRQPPPRRTQAQRSAETRAALLNATIVCLIESGYANLTTRLVAERAGVSQGALQGQFKTKAQLVAAAVRYLQDQVAGQVPAAGRDVEHANEGARAGELLDQLWEFHRSPLATAAMELLIAARTDSGLADAVDDMTERLTAHFAAAANALMGEVTARSGFEAWLRHALVAIHGLALRTIIPRLDVESSWPELRLALLDALPHG
jgi:AcrR family transcriptional regulator